jgi:hypothetical protein
LGQRAENHNYVIATNRDALAASGATSALPVSFGSEAGALIFLKQMPASWSLIEINQSGHWATTDCLLVVALLAESG